MRATVCVYLRKIRLVCANLKCGRMSPVSLSLWLSWRCQAVCVCACVFCVAGFFGFILMRLYLVQYGMALTTHVTLCVSVSPSLSLSLTRPIYELFIDINKIDNNK